MKGKGRDFGNLQQGSSSSRLQGPSNEMGSNNGKNPVNQLKSLLINANNDKDPDTERLEQNKDFLGQFLRKLSTNEANTSLERQNNFSKISGNISKITTDLGDYAKDKNHFSEAGYAVFLATIIHKAASNELLNSEHVKNFIKFWFNLLEQNPVLKHFSPQALANTIWALAKLLDKLPQNFDLEEFPEAFITQAQSKLGDFNPQELANTIWALAKLLEAGKLPQNFDLEEFLKAFITQAQSKLGDFSPQALANTIWALAKLLEANKLPSDIDPEKFLKAFIPQAQSKLRDFNPQALANTIWALALIKTENGFINNDFLKALLNKANEMSNFSIEEKSQILIASHNLPDVSSDDFKRIKTNLLDGKTTTNLARKLQSSKSEDQFLRNLKSSNSFEFNITQGHEIPDLLTGVDFCIKGKDGKILAFIEYDGPNHFVKKEDRIYINTSTKMMSNAINKVYPEIPLIRVSYEIADKNGDEVAKFILEKLNDENSVEQNKGKTFDILQKENGFELKEERFSSPEVSEKPNLIPRGRGRGRGAINAGSLSESGPSSKIDFGEKKPDTKDKDKDRFKDLKEDNLEGYDKMREAQNKSDYEWWGEEDKKTPSLELSNPSLGGGRGRGRGKK